MLKKIYASILAVTVGMGASTAVFAAPPPYSGSLNGTVWTAQIDEMASTIYDESGEVIDQQDTMQFILSVDPLTGESWNDSVVWLSEPYVVPVGTEMKLLHPHGVTIGINALSEDAYADDSQLEDGQSEPIYDWWGNFFVNTEESDTYFEDGFTYIFETAGKYEVLASPGNSEFMEPPFLVYIQVGDIETPTEIPATQPEEIVDEPVKEPLEIAEEPVLQPEPEVPAAQPEPAAPATSAALNVNYTATVDVHVRASASAQSAALGYIPRGQAVNVLDEAYGWYKVQFGAKVGYVSAYYVASPFADQTQKTTLKTVDTFALNVRLGAGVNHTVVGVLKAGETVQVIEVVAGWAKITWYGDVAYVDNSYLK